MASTIQVHVKPTAGGDRITLDVAPTASVADVKEAIAQKNGMSSNEQRLIFKGQILKDDERTIDSYGIVNESVLHLVRGRPAGGSSQPASGAGAPAGNAAAGAAAGGAAAGGFGLPGMPAGLQQAMSAAMNDPAVQSMLNDPELIRTLLQANPAVREVMERNPEVAQILNDPATLREMMRIGSNPALLREHMRTSDRALSNIEALPEGFNALRRLHEQIQEPLMNAAIAPGSNAGTEATAGSGAPAGDPMAALLQQALGGMVAAGTAGTGAGNQGSGANGAAPNAAPLPNPWAPGGGAGAAPGAGAGGGAGVGLGLPAGMGPGFPGLGGLGGMGGLNMNPTEMVSMMQNPVVQQMMQSVASNPAIMEAMINSNPAMRAMADQNPMFRSMMSNPEALRAMFDPQNMAQMMQLMQQMEQMRSSNPLLAQLMGGMAPGAGAAPGTGGGAGAGAAGFPDMSAMAALLSGGAAGAAPFGGLFGMPPPALAPVADPEVTYATQLQQLADMGFFDRQSNIAALQATGGNVHAAVERLLNAP